MSAVELTGAPVAAPRPPRGARLRRLGVVGVVSAGVIAIAAVVALLGPLIAPHDPNAGTLSDAYVGPVPGHPLGFDALGRDLLSRLLVGARTSLVGPLVVVVVATALGTMLAVTAAWRGGWTDAAVSASTDLLFAFPGILLAVVVATAFGASLVAASVTLIIAFTPFFTRVLRAAAQRERVQPYVAALEVQGFSATTICLRHIVPNLLPLIVAQATTLFSYAIVALASISFLGLGIQPPQADWGLMVSAGQAGLTEGYPAECLAAGACIVIVATAFNLLGERLTERAGGRVA